MLNHETGHPTHFYDCNHPMMAYNWLYDRLMALEEAIYSAKNFKKFQNGNAARPDGWQLPESGETHEEP